MKTLMFVCRNFNEMAGGIERMASFIMSNMVDRGHDVILLTWDKKNATSYYQLNPKIKWIKLNLGSPELKASWILRIKRQIAIRNIVKKIKPSLIIGFQVGTFFAFRTAIIGYSIPTIAAERNSPDLYKFIKNGIRKRFLDSIVLLFSSNITIQLENYKLRYPFYLRNRIHTISNPVYPKEIQEYPNERVCTPKIILNIGRLSFQKNQLFLIRSFSLIAKQYPDWVLTIVGEGEYRPLIEELIMEKNLFNQVKLIGAVKDVDYWYKNSAFFAFPSLWEGFPNALVEAFSNGLPALGLNTTAGVNELIVNNKNGLLALHKEKNYALAMKKMIDNISFRKYSGRIASYSIKKYKPELIYDKWEELFLKLSN